jgi:hypothetical protein
MAEHQIRFEDGAVYERNMGTWSRLAGEVFLDWLAPRPGLRTMGLNPPLPPSCGASRMEVLRDLWTGAGLEAIETRNIAVQRTFADFGDFWSTSLLTANLGSIVAAMAPDDVERLKDRVQARLPPDAAGRIICSASANAIKGRKPK